jgi:hypothetical protein
MQLLRKVFSRKPRRFLLIFVGLCCLIRLGFWHVENDIREAAYRYGFEHLGYCPKICKVRFLSVVYGCSSFEHPSLPAWTTPFLLNRFKESNPPVKSCSLCKYDNDQRQIADEKTHETGVEFFTGAIWWVSPDTVKIEVGYYEGLLSASGSIYTLKKKHGRWIVVKDDIVFLS